MAVYPRTFEQWVEIFRVIKQPTECESILGKIVHNENGGHRWVAVVFVDIVLNAWRLAERILMLASCC